MKADRTVVYYTGQRERPEFERRIQAALLNAIGDLPLISVSQKPLDFGDNICVGDVGSSAHNAWRQFQIGAEKANTRFVCAAESDYLYPPEYFSFRPPLDDVFYMPTPMYVVFTQRSRGRGFYLKPLGQEGAVVVARDFLLRRMEQMFAGLPMWVARTETDEDLHRDPTNLHLVRGCALERFRTRIPTINFKTERNLHQRTQRSIRGVLDAVPHWGRADDLVRRFA